MQLGFWQVVIVALFVVLLFGRGKISELMGDVAKGITSFKKGLKEDADDLETDVVESIEHKAGETVTPKKGQEQQHTTG